MPPSRCLFCSTDAVEDDKCYGCGAHIHEACFDKDRRCVGAMGSHGQEEHIDGTDGGCGECGPCEASGKKPRVRTASPLVWWHVRSAQTSKDLAIDHAYARREGAGDSPRPLCGIGVIRTAKVRQGEEPRLCKTCIHKARLDYGIEI